MFFLVDSNMGQLSNLFKIMKQNTVKHVQIIAHFIQTCIYTVVILCQRNRGREAYARIM